MDAKEFLSQAYKIDIQINTKLEALQMLDAQATKATAVLTGMPHSPNRGTSSLEATICKIIDLQEEINRDVYRLVSIKEEIKDSIAKIDNTDYRVILEKRYILGKKWEEIAVELGYELRWVHRLHRKALEQIKV